MQQLFSRFAPILHVQDAHTGEIAARSAEAVDKLESERIEAYHEDDRQGPRLLTLLSRSTAGLSATISSHLAANQISHQRR